MQNQIVRGLLTEDPTNRHIACGNSITDINSSVQVGIIFPTSLAFEQDDFIER